MQMEIQEKSSEGVLLPSIKFVRFHVYLPNVLDDFRIQLGTQWLCDLA